MQIELTSFYARLAVILAIIALGFILAKLKLISEATNKDLVGLLLKVFMPAALFSAFPATFNGNSLGMFTSGLLAGLVVMTAVIVISRIIFNKSWYRGEMRYSSQFAFIFNNATFLGYPIVSQTFGPDGILAYCGFIIIFNIALFSYGVWLFKRKLSARLVVDVLLDPNIIAVLLGMAFFLIHWQLPAPVTQTVSLVAGATTPLSLICIGYMLSHAKFRKSLRKWRLVATAAIQLIVGPTVTYLLLSWLGFPTEVILVCTLIQALPTATSLALFAKRYGGNDIEASELVSISTVLSCVTLPIILSLFLI
jgi:predicted permease